MACTTVFIISDDFAIRGSVAELVAAAGLRAETFASVGSWLDAVPPERRGPLVLDARVRDFTGSERLADFTSVYAKRPVLVLIDRGDVPMAVRAMRDGAVAVVEKPYRDENLLERIKRAAAA
jgi:two-component system response regulator FixJ